MNNVIAAFFASNFIAAEGNAAIGVLSYAMSFVFVPEDFMEGDFTVIADSAAVDAGVTVEEMNAWINANVDEIAAAIAVVGNDIHGPRPSVQGDATWLAERGITAKQYYKAWERRHMS